MSYNPNAGGAGAAAWVYFRSTGVLGSHNVSSITDLGSRFYRVNFTTALSTSEYAWTGSCEVANDYLSGGAAQDTDTHADKTTSSHGFYHRRYSASDPGYTALISVAYFE